MPIQIPSQTLYLQAVRRKTVFLCNVNIIWQVLQRLLSQMMRNKILMNTCFFRFCCTSTAWARTYTRSNTFRNNQWVHVPEKVCDIKGVNNFLSLLELFNRCGPDDISLFIPTRLIIISLARLFSQPQSTFYQEQYDF